MLTFHGPGKTKIEDPVQGAAIPGGVSWIDAFRPGEEEIAYLERALGISVPTLDILSEIETSSRLRSDRGWLHLSIPVIHRKEGGVPALTPLGLSLSKDMLLTIRFEPLKILDEAAVNISGPGMPAGGAAALMTIIEAVVDHAADVLERAGADLDILSQEIFRANGAGVPRNRPRDDSRQLRSLLREIGRNGDLASKIEDLLLGLARMLPYVAANASYLESGVRVKLKSLQRDVESLNDYETHLTDKIQLLLDATVGLTNVDQNNIFRILTIVSVVGIPPTFFASMWGMNFKNMPEYSWAYGYEFGLAVIALSAIIPVVWFKWRGWW